MTDRPTISNTPPLSPDEKGRGTSLPPARVEEIEQYCVASLKSGRTQYEIAAALGASRSRVSRWCISGLEKFGDATDHRLVKLGSMSLTQMMWARMEVRGQDECWPWRGAIKPNGYGILNFHGKAYNAHRLVFEALVSAIPSGLVIDHICRNPRCVNPHHLQAVSQSLNLSLGYARRRAA